MMSSTKLCVLLFILMISMMSSVQRLNVIPNSHQAKNFFHQAMLHSVEATQLGAIMMLVGNWTEQRYMRKCHFNASMDSLASKWRPHNPYPIILLDNKPWSHEDMLNIRRTWTTLDFRFINVATAFNYTPNISMEDSNKPLSAIEYKQMCHFFFKGFTEVPVLMSYRYLLRMDDDTCIVDHINFDIFKLLESKNAAYAYSHIWYDEKRVTSGLYQFVNDYVQNNSLTYQNSKVYKRVIQSPHFPSRVPSYNTNFEVINTVRYRHKAVMNFVQAVVDSDMIFHRRWGDAPLRFATAMLFWTRLEVERLESFELQHSSWDPLKMTEARPTSDPDLYL